MVEYWNVGLNKELIDFVASLSKGILPIDQYPIFPEPIIPVFQYSNCERSELSSKLQIHSLYTHL